MDLDAPVTVAVVVVVALLLDVELIVLCLGLMSIGNEEVGPPGGEEDEERFSKAEIRDFKSITPRDPK